MNTDLFRGKHVHCMGIGGAGVSALVPLLEQAGANVSGCDLSRNTMVETLAAQGTVIALGHDAQHVNDIDILVHSSAVPDSHSEIRAAKQQGVLVLSRPACLAELMGGMRTLAVAGSHGKTSTTWMAGHLMTAAGADPVVMVGGKVASLQGGARRGGGRCFIAEVDESDGGFAHTNPEVAIVTNLEAEHVRHYGGFAQLCDAFRDWLAAMGRADTVIVPAKGLPPQILAGVSASIVTTGIDCGDWQAREVHLGAESSTFELQAPHAAMGSVHVPIPGKHMVENAVMAIAAVHALHGTVDVQRLHSCERVARRFTVHGVVNQVRVVEDYAHHPTEIRATLATAALAGGRLHVLFQPHRHSRTADCFHELCNAFSQAHAVAITPVYAGGETPIAGASGQDLAEAIAVTRGPECSGLTQYVSQREAGIGFVTAHAQAGDTILILGAGDIGQAAAPIVEQLQ